MDHISTELSELYAQTAAALTGLYPDSILPEKLNRLSREIDRNNYRQYVKKLWTVFSDELLPFCESDAENSLGSRVLSLQEKLDLIIEGTAKSNVIRKLFSEKPVNWEKVFDAAVSGINIGYVDDLTERYSGAGRRTAEEKLSQLKDILENNGISICLVGEFSVGKSSFINAFLGTELLKTGITQKTTCTIAVVEYSQVMSVTVEFLNEKKRTFQFTDEAQLKKTAEEYISSSEGSEHISRVIIGYPSEKLRQGIRFVDTPGINTYGIEYEEIVNRAVSDYSELVLVFVDATKQLPEEYCSFIKDNMGENISDCVFIASKTDLLDDDNAELVLSYINDKVSNIFGVHDPVVFPFSPEAVLRGEEGRASEQSVKSEKLFVEYINEKRTMIKTEKLLSLAHEIYESLYRRIKRVYGREKKKSDDTGDTAGYDTELVKSENSFIIMEFVQLSEEIVNETTGYINSKVNSSVLEAEREICSAIRRWINLRLYYYAFSYDDGKKVRLDIAKAVREVVSLKREVVFAELMEKAAGDRLKLEELFCREKEKLHGRDLLDDDIFKNEKAVLQRIPDISAAADNNADIPVKRVFFSKRKAREYVREVINEQFLTAADSAIKAITEYGGSLKALLAEEARQCSAACAEHNEKLKEKLDHESTYVDEYFTETQRDMYNIVNICSAFDIELLKQKA